MVMDDYNRAAREEASDDEVARLVRTDSCAWRVFLYGYQWGHIEGAASQRLSDEDLAAFAARLALANLEVQDDVRQAAQRAREWIDVALAREKRRIANANRPDSRTGWWAA